MLEPSIEDSLHRIDRCFQKLKNDGHLKSVSFDFQEFSVDIVEKQLRDLASTSSAGSTEIPVCVLKFCSVELAPLFVKLFNFCTKLNSIPSEWKLAFVTPLLKKGDPLVCDNYRAISVISPLCKIFEKLLARQITKHFDENSLFVSDQHGFRKNKSCETALHSILNTWKMNMDSGNINIALFIDFKKAFDMVESQLLLRKLIHYGFSNNAEALMRNYFCERTQIVKINGVKSDPCDLQLGVPQGSVLGPLLFNIFINDIVFTVGELLVTLFADDTTLHTNGTSIEACICKLKKNIEPFLEWVLINHLKINWDKTKVMFISRSAKNSSELKNICFSNTDVEVVDNFKLLGVIIDTQLCFDGYVKHISRIVNCKLFSIKKLFYLSQSVRCQFFKSFILPHFDYCASLAIYFRSTLIKQLEKLFNNCLYFLLKVNLKNADVVDQEKELKRFNIFPFKLRLFTKFCFFSFKVVNRMIHDSFCAKLVPWSVNHNSGRYELRSSQKLKDSNTIDVNRANVFEVPELKYKDSQLSVTFFIPNFVNNVIKNSIRLSYKDFSNFINSNSLILYSIWEKLLYIP